MKDNIDLAYFTEHLLDLQEEIMGVAGLVGNAAKPVELDQNKVGRLSRMDAIQGQAMAQASLGRQQELLSEIEQALNRIDSGEYGHCLECDQSIALARLKIDPIAHFCIECATKLEKK